MKPLQPTSHSPAPVPITPSHNCHAPRPAHRARKARAAAIAAALLFTLLGVLPAAVTAAPPAAPAAAELPGGCTELIGNGSFEQLNTVWYLPPSLNAPTYDNSNAFSGNFSMRLGNVDMANVASSSRAEQTVALPANASSIILSFRYFGRTDDEVALGNDDRQYLDIFDAGTNQFIVRQFEARNKDRLWLGAQYSLTAYRGRTVRLSFGVDNDGQNARLAMNLDDVSLYYCTSTPTALPTQTPTWTPTFVPTFFPTPTFFPPATGLPPSTFFPTSTPLPPDPGCTNILVNGDFESDAGWIFGPNSIPAQYVWTFRHTGNRSAQLGNPPNFRPDAHSFSSMRQLVTIPANSPIVQLRWFHIQGTEETPADIINIGEDRQEVVLLNSDLSTLAVVYRVRRNEGAFVQDVVDLTQYRGRSVYVYFNAFNDGNGRRTWMYVDNALLCVDVQAVPYAGQQTSGYAAAGGNQNAVGSGGQTTVIQRGLGDGSQGQGMQPQPDYSAPATLTPTPTEYANPAPAGQAPGNGASGAAVATLPIGPEVQPGEATPDANPAADVQNFAQTAADSTASGDTAEVSAETQPVTRRNTTVTIAALCLVLLAVGGLSIGILRAISRPRNPAP